MGDLLTTLVTVQVFLLIYAGYIASKLSSDIIKLREITVFRALIGAFAFYMAASCVWTLQEYEAINMPYNAFFALCFCSLLGISSCAYLFFLSTMLRVEPTLLEKRGAIAVLSLPVGIILCCLVVNLFNRMIYDITPDKHIVYNRVYIIIPLLSSLYLVGILIVAVIQSLHARNHSRRKQAITLALSIIFVMICVVIDDRLKRTTILPPALFGAIFFVFVNMQESSIYSDALTGMNNRRKAGEFLESQMDTLSKDNPMMLYMADLNRFKQINDNFGHSEGDQALVLCAYAIKSSLGQFKAFAARYGGDEFIFSFRPAQLPDDLARPEAIIETIQARLSQLCKDAGKPYALSLSAGWYRCESPAQSLAECVRQADEMLYIRKASL